MLGFTSFVGFFMTTVNTGINQFFRLYPVKSFPVGSRLSHGGKLIVMIRAQPGVGGTNPGWAAEYDEIREVIRTMAQAQFFDLPEKSFVYTGDENNEIEFQKAVKLHSIVVDDGASRAHRDFAEGRRCSWSMRGFSNRAVGRKLELTSCKLM
jgi:hypothetical protein